MQKRASDNHIGYDTYFSPIPVEQSEPIYFSGIFAKLPFADDFPFLHYHDRYEIGICESGEGLFLSEGVFSSVSKGDLIFVAPSHRHYSRSLDRDTPCICRFAYFSIDVIERLISLSAAKNKETKSLIDHVQNIPTVIHPTEHPKSAELLKRIIDACIQKSDEGNMTSALLFAAFVINAHTFFPSISPPRAITKTNDAASQIAEYLSLHYCDSDSSKSLAEKCHLSESQLRRRFICAYGLPPIAYRNQLRCQIAAELLKRTSMTVLDISGRIGFNATSDFYRAFKKAYGTSPSGYRSLRCD